MSKDIQQLEDIKLYIQDIEYIVKAEDVTPNTSLNAYIRDTLQLTGTKALCYQGGCGSCVVVLYTKDPVTEKDIYLGVNSCLIPLLSCNGWRIYTIEGIGDPVNGFHTIQETLAKFNGTQCGFCSPGMVMNMYALYESGKLTMKEVENSFGGNICRCTGYRPILSAFKSLCTDATPEILGQYPDIEDLKVCKKDKCEQKCATKCSLRKEAFYLQLADSKWMKVYDMPGLLGILDKAGDSTYRLVAGNTAKGVFPAYGSSVDIYIDITSVSDLKVNKFVDTTYVLGASTSLTTAMAVLNQVGIENPQFSYFKQLANHIDLVANVPVRNTGTLAGNLMMKHDNHEFPSDIFLILETVNAKLVIVGTDGQEIQYSPHDFINIDMKLKVLVAIVFPSYDSNTVKYVSYKIMPRAQNAHAHVNAGFLFRFNTDNTLYAATIVFGNINSNFIHATKTEVLLAGKNIFENDILQQALASLSGEIECDNIPPDPSPEFRKQLALSLFYKAVLSIAPADKLSPRNKSGGTLLERPVSTGAQDYETNESLYPLTEAIPKLEALAQTSGQAQFIRDMPDVPHQLYSTLILAAAPPNSTIKTIDASKALEIEGIVAFYSHDDIPGKNNFTPRDILAFQGEEEILCSGLVRYYNQPLGILVGNSQAILRQASSLVEVTYNPPTVAPLLSVREVLKNNRTDRITKIQTITPTRTGNDVKHIINGKFDIYHQYHFHMETQSCIVIPNENGLDMYPSTQWMDQIQLAVAQMLNINQSKINVSVRRLGGGFGAKISRNGLISCATALAAYKLNKPVKMFMTLPDNMAAIGKRFPFSVDYEVGLNDKGVIQYLTSYFYSDLGAVFNEIPTGEIVHNFRDSYLNDSFKIEVNVVQTDTHNNTWARAPGSTEGLGSIEAIMEHCAMSLGLDPLEMRISNFPANSPLQKYVDDLKSWANIDERKTEIDTFNKENRWKKKGLTIVPMSYYLGVSGPFTAVVSIYHGDGSVQISHGGIEMGQGINTKAAQVCAYKLQIPLEKVTVIPSNSFNAPNNMVTGGSVTSESICYSIIQACDQLIARIQPYKDKNPSGTWEQWVKASFDDYVNLSAIGIVSPKIPDVKSYQIYGVCAVEVILDILTGQHLVNRVDLIEDTGQSMSPNVDIGQVEGAFIMGLGYYTTEKIIFDSEGKILTDSTWTYYPPGPKDIPIDFRIKFPKDNPNPVGVLKSKATAEPPLCMTIALPLAIRNAIASARLDAGLTEKWFPFDGPTTVENVYQNSGNDYKQYIL